MTEPSRSTRPVAWEWGPPRPSPVASRPSAGRAGGFTLVELLVVMVIISILLGLILNASMASVKRAQERATQSLITKLETGLNDRLDALMQNRPDPNSAHLALASVYNSNYYGVPAYAANNNGAMSGFLRAQVISWYDYIKREMPDTFFVQNTSGPYPLNFAANPYPLSGGTATDPNGLGQYILPLGNSITSNTIPVLGDGSGTGYKATTTGGLMEYNPGGEGIYGAAYPVAAGIYKNLGYQPTGYDGVDNDGNGMIDDWKEGVGTAASGWQPDATVVAQVQANLGNHKHITARAEMLYAILVEGRGPLGSVFNRDEFTDKEVQDTDGDGLPEFVDAWGNPLQFFRWPILYHSDLQRGQFIATNSESSWSLLPPHYEPSPPNPTNAGIMEQREQDPMDLNQQLVAPAWWSNGYNNSAVFSGYPTLDGNYLSGTAQAFEYYFHRLTEPISGGGGGAYWDRGATYGNRRAFYSKFLIVSAGLDGLPGVFLYSDAALSASQNPAWALIANENNAMPFSATDTSGGFIVDFTRSSICPNNQYGGTAILYTDSLDSTNPSTGDLIQYAQDDITNQNIQVSAGAGGGG